MKFKLSVIIPVYNNYNFTKDLLGDLFYCTRNSNGFNFEAVNNYEFIIVDNASTDETKNIETAKINKPQNLKYIRNDINLGFAKACNIGYKESNGEFILFLNNDVRSTKVKDYQNKIEKAIWAHEYLNKLELDEPFNKIIGPTGGELNDDFSFKREVAKFENGDKYLNEFNKTYLSG